MTAPDTTLTDIHTAVGDLLDAPELDDAAIDAELDAKTDAAVDADAGEAEETGEATPEPTGVPDATGEPVADTTPEEPDPLANAKPFDYTVDGQSKVYDGIKVLSDKDGNLQGAIIEPAALKDVQYRIQRGEYLEGQNKALYEQTKAFDAITFTDRATNQQLKGLAAVESYVVENAKQHAALTLLADTLENPDKLVALALAVQSGDTSPLRALTERLALIAENATYKTKASFGQTLQQAKAQEASTQDRAQVTTTALTNAVEHWAKQFPSLTKDDTQKAIAYFSKIGSAIVRPATPDEATTAGVKPGDLIIDHPVLYEYLSDRASLRQDAIARSTAAQQAAQENAAKLAAAARGTKPKPAPTKAAPKAKATTAPEGSYSEWRDRMMRGEFSTDDDE